MGFFQLDPASIAGRARAADAHPPSLGASLLRGIFGFTLVSVAGFSPWALLGGFFHKMAHGEIAMYAACAIVFIVLSGLLLHGLIIGPESLGRFYKLFGIAFTAYSIAWIVGWITLRGHIGGAVGLFSGTLLMGLIFGQAFDSGIAATIRSVLALFVLNAAGYFGGGVVEHEIVSMKAMSVFGIGFDQTQTRTIAMLSWGVCYGLGFGAGLGLAFYFCQAKARALLNDGRPRASKAY